MRRLVVLAIAALFAVPVGARAEHDGCIAWGSHVYTPTQPWLCSYTATGPGDFVASTSNPFVIYAERAGVPGKIMLATRTVPGRPTRGKLATQPGDKVSVSISCWDYAIAEPCPPESIAGGRDGVIVAQSEL